MKQGTENMAIDVLIREFAKQSVIWIYSHFSVFIYFILIWFCFGCDPAITEHQIRANRDYRNAEIQIEAFPISSATGCGVRCAYLNL